MDDFVLNVRQIMEFPLKAAAAPTDAVLLQANGLGGPYQFSTAYGLVTGALDWEGADLGVGIPLPGDASNTGVLSTNFLTPLGCTFGWNFYLTAAGPEPLGPGPALAMCFDSGGWWLDYIGTGNLISVDLTGTLTVANDLFVSGSGQVTNDFAVGGELLASSLDIGSNATFGGTIAVQGNAEVGGNFEVAGSQYIGGGLNVQGGEIVAGGIAVSTVTTEYVDTAFINVGGNAVVGGTLLLGLDPVLPLEAATKQYVDNTIAAEIANALLDDVVNSFNGRTGAVTLELGDITDAGGAPLNSPALTGIPTAPTASVSNVGSQIATTAFVLNAIGAYITQYGFVFSFNGRTGYVELRLSDITDAGGAPIDSPDFQGIPTAPTPVWESTDASIATTAFVKYWIAATVAGVATFNGRTGNVELDLDDILDAGGAPLNSPQFTGTPTAWSPPPFDFSMRLATTEWVTELLGNYLETVVFSWNGRTGNVVMELGDILNAGGAPIQSPEFHGHPSAPTPEHDSCDTSLATTEFFCRWLDEIRGWIFEDTVVSFNERRGHVTLLLNDILAAGGAPINSPHFTGVPTAPTPPAGDASNRIATTEFVRSAIEKNLPERGPPGPAGPQGHPGQSFQIKASVPTWHELPEHGNQPGDVRMAEDTGIGYVWVCEHDHGHQRFGINTRGGIITPPPRPEPECYWSAIGFLRGPRGERGEEGPPGPQGEMGRGLYPRGHVANQFLLPLHGNEVGDFFITDDTGNGWSWNGFQWVNIGQMRGPPGAASTVPGPPGPQGPAGPSGPGLFFRGVIADPTELPPTGDMPGDMYLVESTQTLWVWDGTTWVDTGQGLAGTIPEAPNDGLQYVRQNLGWTALDVFSTGIDGLVPGPAAGQTAATGFYLTPAASWVSAWALRGDFPAGSVLGNSASTSGYPIPINIATLTTALTIFSTVYPGIVPATDGADPGDVLLADGTWGPALDPQPAYTFFGNYNDVAAVPAAMTVAQARDLIGLFSPTQSGLVYAPGAAPADAVLRADNTFSEIDATDIANGGGALLNSPAFTGTPTAPTALVGTATPQLATTAFVAAALANLKVRVTKYLAAGGYVFAPGAGTVVYTMVELQGGGGPGGGAYGSNNSAAVGGGGGGSGGKTIAYLTPAQIGASQFITVGAGGVPTNVGGTTSFGPLLTALGGQPGTTNALGTGGNWGQGGFGAGPGFLAAGVQGMAYSGFAGSYGLIDVNGFAAWGGIGGGSGNNVQAAGQAGVVAGLAGTFGAGGSGAALNQAVGQSAPGGTGGDGYAVITEFYY